MDNFNELHDLEHAIYFSSPVDKEKREEVIEEEQNSDWGDVDPAAGETPTSPGSAV